MVGVFCFCCTVHPPGFRVEQRSGTNGNTPHLGCAVSCCNTPGAVLRLWFRIHHPNLPLFGSKHPVANNLRAVFCFSST